MRAGAERSRAQWSRVAVSAQKDTKMASVAMCQACVESSLEGRDGGLDEATKQST